MKFHVGAVRESPLRVVFHGKACGDNESEPIHGSRGRFKERTGPTPGTGYASPRGRASRTSPTRSIESDIYRDWCKGCGICAAFCPRQCLGLDAEGNPVVEKAERCTGCRWCELHCPDFAICVREVEKAAEDAAKP